MQISLRPQVFAGAAAVVGATAVAMSTVSAVALGPSAARVQVPALAGVELAAFASPLLEIFDTVEKANLYLFSIAEPPVTTFDRAGIIPDFLAAGFPIVTQYFLNAPDYVDQTVNYLFADFGGTAPIGPYPGALRLLTWAADALPANLFFAAQQLLAGNLVGTLQTLQFAMVNPVQAALYQTLNAGMYALGGVGVRAAAVITAIAEWVPTTIRNLVDDVTVVLNAAGAVASGVAFGIQTLNLETVWNSMVVGLLGSVPNPVTPTIPDALINQTIGEGGRIYTVPGRPGYLEVPSLRQNLTELRDDIADALATDVPIPAEPPFPVSLLPYQSQVPTPWNPTPRPPAAALPAAAGASAKVTADAAVRTARAARASAVHPSDNSPPEGPSGKAGSASR